MNINMATSFIVGGLLLISILTLNNMVMKDSYDTAIHERNRNRINTLRQMISQDFERIGFGDGAMIQSFDPPHRIVFRADVLGYGPAQVIWHFRENVQNHDTGNPDDRELQRNGPLDETNGSKPTKFTVIDFAVTGYSDAAGSEETEQPAMIKSLRVEVVYESAEPLGDGPNRYQRSTWSKHFVPYNLQLEKVITN